MKKIQLVMVSLLLGVAMLTTSCEKWNPWDDGKPGGGGGANTESCTLFGTLVRVPCGVSDLNNLWIKADNGKYYQPCDAGVLQTMDIAYPMEEGTRIQFGYKVINGSPVCDQEQVILCGAAWPQRTRIKITCIQPVFRCGTVCGDTLLRTQ
jgi:hypothetical protein